MGTGAGVDLLTAADRQRAREILAAAGLDGHRPVVGLHASGGRPVKQWPADRWREVARRLQREFGAALLLTGTAADRHLAAEVATGLGSVFGPSDPRRYFSGGTGGPDTRHVVVHAELWCAPCNLIRRPPRECLGADGPECLRLVTVDAVHAAAARLLLSGVFVVTMVVAGLGVVVLVTLPVFFFAS